MMSEEVDEVGVVRSVAVEVITAPILVLAAAGLASWYSGGTPTPLQWGAVGGVSIAIVVGLWWRRSRSSRAG